MSEYDRLKAQKNAMLRAQKYELRKKQVDTERRLHERIGRLQNLLRIALADLTGVRAGMITPEKLKVFLVDCRAELNQPSEVSDE